VKSVCPLDCRLCPALEQCGGGSNFCLLGRCDDCREQELLRMDVRRRVMEELSGLAFTWPRPVRHHQPAELPLHLPVLIQAYADPVDVPWVALHAGRVLGVTGSQVTPKHLARPLHEVYRLAPGTRIALEFYVEDRVLAGLWANRRLVIEQLRQLAFDLVLAPNVSVWRDESRFNQLAAERRAFVLYHEFREAGLPAIPDVGFSRFEPDGRRWAEWMDAQADLQAVSIFCGGQKVHAERRAHRETVEDIALLHRAVRPDFAFVLGGIHAAERLADYRRAAPDRQLVICNGMAYALAQRRRLLSGASADVARSARECFLLNCQHNERMYVRVLGEETR
jgi:hypothetical protein